MDPIPIAEDIFQVGGNGLTAPEDAAIYLIKAGNRSALIDAGCGQSLPQLTENMRLCGVDPKRLDYLLITRCHFDHSGGAKSLRDRSGCRLVAHEQDALFLETGDDQVTAASWYGRQISPVSIDRKLVHFREEIVLEPGPWRRFTFRAIPRGLWHTRWNPMA